MQPLSRPAANRGATVGLVDARAVDIEGHDGVVVDAKAAAEAALWPRRVAGRTGYRGYRGRLAPAHEARNGIHTLSYAPGFVNPHGKGYPDSMARKAGVHLDRGAGFADSDTSGQGGSSGDAGTSVTRGPVAD